MTTLHEWLYAGAGEHLAGLRADADGPLTEAEIVAAGYTVADVNATGLYIPPTEALAQAEFRYTRAQAAVDAADPEGDADMLAALHTARDAAHTAVKALRPHKAPKPAPAETDQPAPVGKAPAPIAPPHAEP